MLNLKSGRVSQKLRTRDQLVAAAVKMVQEGRTPSVTDVADATQIGRTTAYRYFPTPEALLIQAVFAIVGEPDDHEIYDVFAKTDDVRKRVAAVFSASAASVSAHEAGYRALLRLSLEPQLVNNVNHRPAYRLKWLTDALAPIRTKLSKAAFSRLLGGLSLCIGVEATVVLDDVCHFTPSATADTKQHIVDLLIDDALKQARERSKAKTTVPAGAGSRKH